jgi:polysaccharide export outer membrane protein
MKTRMLIVMFLLLLPAVVCGNDYVIGEGDTLYVSVWGEEALSLSVKVRPDGKITIPALGDVTAAGLAPNDLQGLLTKKLEKLIKKPVVNVIVQEITNNKVYVFGGGVKSGIYNLVRRTTLLQLLCQIEDFENADLEKAYVLRNGKKVKEGFHKLFIEGDISEDVTVEPNDVVFIPTAVRNIYVVGAVREPRFVSYREGMTVMEAILSAGGFTETAKQNGTVIFRKVGQKKVSIPVKIKKLLRDGKLEQNVKLMPGDYVVVEESFF